ncbi:MAG: N-acetylmuramic acid 6-phosphate etherase [Candidatus Omnitrophica bacterium]|nr:N-acetylmuramic acid 6-phosphate etherase [Candidatus Omnitrophota bacterium]
MARVRYDRLPTEQHHPRSHDLDRLSPEQLVTLMNREDAGVIRAVARQRRQIARAIRLIAHGLRCGGRLFFLGAGASGRLGVIEAAECPPTFHTSPALVQAFIAGGRRAVFRSQEGAEDRGGDARTLVRRRIQTGDVVVGIAASGVTPFVTAGLAEAAKRGAGTVLVTCNPRPASLAHLRIVLLVGPEVLTGSTRLKAGTATKLVLNMLTVGAMVQLGKTYGNLMVDVRPTSNKLRARAISMIRQFARCSEPDAARLLHAAHGQVKSAVVMSAQRVAYPAARRRLARASDSLRKALEPARQR